MVRRIGLTLVWLGFAAYAFLLAPPDRPDTLTLIQNLSLGNWQGINPLVIALFNLMGIWPAIYACVLLADGHGQRVRAWPFVMATFAVGAFALLPYLVLRSPNPTPITTPSLMLRVTNSRWTGVVLLVGAIALVSYGFSQGDWPDFIQQWQSSRFIHVMSLDFCLLTLLFPTLLTDDLARRDGTAQGWLKAIAVIPLFGALGYLILRPSLEQATIAPTVIPDH